MKKITSLLFCCNLFFTLQCAGQIYVSPGGVDAPGNGTVLSPYQTVQYAHDNAPAGSIIQLTSGTFPIIAPIVITKHITIRGASGSPGQYSVISASGWAGSNQHMFHIDGVDKVTLSLLRLQDCIGSGACGIYIAGACDSITITSCQIRNIGWQSNNLVTPPVDIALDNAHAIHVVGNAPTAHTRLNIFGNSIVNCAIGFSEAITLTGYVVGFLIASNNIDSIQNIGICLAGGYGANSNPSNDYPNGGTVRFNMVRHCMSAKKLSAGIYLDGATACIVENNQVKYNGVGISIGAEQTGVSPVYSNFIRNNAVAENVAAGIYIGSSNPANVVNRTYVYNNTFFKNRTGQIINGITHVDGIPVTTHGDIHGGEVHLYNNNETDLYNNIMYARDGHQNLLVLDGYTTTQYQADYNLYYRDDNNISLEIVGGNLGFNGAVTSGYFDIDDFKASYGLDSHSIMKQNPGFIFADNYNTSDISPTVDKGTPTHTPGFNGTIDYQYNVRVYNGIRIDIGAFEFQGMPTSGFANTAKPKHLFTLYPNPTQGNIYLQSVQPIAVVTIYQMNGQQALSVKNPKNHISLQTLPKGVYTVVCKMADGSTDQAMCVLR